MRVIFVTTLLLLAHSVSNASGCEYWNTLVDPSAPKVSVGNPENNSTKVMEGIPCLLKLEGRKGLGVRYGQKSHVSQTVPRATVEVNALYKISELFYGNNDFADAIALTADPPKLMGEFEVEEFNSPKVVEKAFASYRKWFAKVTELGLGMARKRGLDPLSGSGVKWY